MKLPWLQEFSILTVRCSITAVHWAGKVLKCLPLFPHDLITNAHDPWSVFWQWLSGGEKTITNLTDIWLDSCTIYETCSFVKDIPESSYYACTDPAYLYVSFVIEGLWRIRYSAQIVDPFCSTVWFKCLCQNFKVVRLNFCTSPLMIMPLISLADVYVLLRL